MKIKPKIIPMPKLESAQELTPLQLNELKINIKHTVLTPEFFEQNVDKQTDTNINIKGNKNQITD